MKRFRIVNPLDWYGSKITIQEISFQKIIIKISEGIHSNDKYNPRIKQTPELTLSQEWRFGKDS